MESTDPEQMVQLAGQIQAALETADLNGYRELLDPDVTWGAPDDAQSGCRNRDQVLAWYRRGRAKGVRAVINETVIHHDKILVGLSIRDSQSPSHRGGGPTARWQILTVKSGRIVDIRGFEDRAAAASRMT
jgi:ketosteroid isomerase-like protein